MRICILNGNPEENRRHFDDYLGELKENLDLRSHQTSLLDLKQKNIEQCRGCFACWVKNSGRCIFEDDMEIVCREVINSDLLIFASPVIMGFTSALLKKTQDRFIPLILPYIELDQEECHHKKRYHNYPKLGLIIEEEEATDSEDLDIITDIYKRLALNFKSELVLNTTLATTGKELANEIDHL